MTTNDKPAATRMIPLSQLHPARGTRYDVRKGGNGDIAELKASIKSIGLLIPLAVKEDGGKTIVVAGNRRLAALRELYPSLDKEVQTVDADDFHGDARVMAMATNIQLPPHPIERYEVIAALIKEGMTPAEAQERFALSEKVFRQTMRLGSLAPKIRDAYRDGEIDGETARAFALTDDVKAQEKVYNLLKKTSHNGDIFAGAVVHHLGGSSDTGKLVRFVGVETVASAGILSVEDLFSSNHNVTDFALLNKMVADKFEQEAKALTDAGWSWAAQAEILGQDRHYYGWEHPTAKKPTDKEMSRMNEISKILSDAPEDEDEWTTEQLDMHEEHRLIEIGVKLRGFTPAQKAASGCILSVDHFGSLKIDYGRTKPRAASKASAADKPAAKKDAKPGEVAVVSNKLAERLSGGLQEAMAMAFGAEPHIAVAALVAAFASGGHVLDVRIGSGGYGTAKDFVSVFDGAKKAKPEQLVSMLMKVAQQALKIVTFNAASVPVENEAVAAVLAAMNPGSVNAAIAGKFELDDYLRSISVAGIADAVRTTCNDADADRVLRMSKKDAVKTGLDLIGKTGWLPKELRTVHYKGPTEAAPAPKKSATPMADAMTKKRGVKAAKKAAPANKAAKKKSPRRAR